MTAIGIAFALVAALIHVYIFYLESLAWTGPTAAKIFGIESQDFAQTTKHLAFNQGFYNLFLAITVLVGVMCMLTGATTVGTTLILTGTGSMTAAGTVLFLHDPTKRSAALKQLTAPLLAVITLGIGLLG